MLWTSKSPAGDSTRSALLKEGLGSGLVTGSSAPPRPPLFLRLAPESVAPEERFSQGFGKPQYVGVGRASGTRDLGWVRDPSWSRPGFQWQMPVPSPRRPFPGSPGSQVLPASRQPGARGFQRPQAQRLGCGSPRDHGLPRATLSVSSPTSSDRPDPGAQNKRFKSAPSAVPPPAQVRPSGPRLSIAA